MLPDPDALADLVIQTIDTAIGPVLERLAAAEARLSTLGDLRDRVVTVETKAAVPLPPPVNLEAVLSPVLARLEAIEARPPVPGPPGDAGVPGPPGEPGPIGVKGLDGRDGRDGLPGVPGATGEKGMNGIDGKDGANGLHGKDGADGLGFEDLDVEFNGDRTLSLKFTRGDVVKVFPVVLPFLKYLGVYQEGKAYGVGDVVTWGGSTWNANEPTTTKPGDGSKAWTLIVKRGRDGKDGQDAPAIPVVSIGRGR